MRFRDRVDAGRELGRRVRGLDLQAPIVLALPRGGVPVAAEVAALLHAPLYVFLAQELRAPANDELAIGAVAEGLDDPVLADTAGDLNVTTEEVCDLAARARAELERRRSVYHRAGPVPALDGRDAVLVDDGLATGLTAEAALRALRHRRPRQLVLAIPICARQILDRVAPLADCVVCAEITDELIVVARWYEVFWQATDDEVLELLARARPDPPPIETGACGPPDPTPV